MSVSAKRPRWGRRAAIAIGAAAAIAAFPRSASAFHSYSSWDELPLEGGAGSVYFMGLPSERGWDCTMCHEKAPRRIRAQVTSDPPELVDRGEFAPGTLYKIIVQMEGESLGARANVNSMSFALLNAEGGLAARTPPVATAFSAAGQESMKGADNLPYRFSDGLLENATRWEIELYTPCEGGIDFYFGIVDGNGANDKASKNQDPQGDDVFMGHLAFRPNGPGDPSCPMTAEAAPRRPRGGDAPAWGGAALGLGLAAGLRRGRRGDRDNPKRVGSA